MNKVAYRLARLKLMDDMRWNLNRPEVSTMRRCECGMWTRGCFTKCVCCQAKELRELELNQNKENE
jgi:hypothetical protein